MLNSRFPTHHSILLQLLTVGPILARPT